MSLTFTVTPVTGGALTFGAIGHTNSRQALDFDPGAPLQDQKRFHAPGVAGQFLIRGAQVGRNVSVVVRYWADDVAGVEALYQADADKFASEQVTIACAGQTYHGLNLDPSSMRRAMRIRPTGRGTACICDVAMVFTQDNPGGV
jgi:hypothetical protein